MNGARRTKAKRDPLSAASSIYANHMPQKIDPKVDYQWQDQGVQTFRMIRAPHVGVWQDTNMVHVTEELVAPALVFYQGIHTGARPQMHSFLSLDAPDVVTSLNVSAAVFPKGK